MNWFNYRRGLALSLNMGGLALGASLFSITFGLIDSYCSDYFNYFFLLIMILIAGICLPIAFFVIKTNPEQMGLSPHGDNRVRIHIHEKKTKREEKIYNRLYFSNALRPIGKLNSHSTTKLFF
jgi:MFS family permease